MVSPANGVAAKNVLSGHRSILFELEVFREAVHSFFVIFRFASCFSRDRIIENISDFGPGEVKK